MSEQQESALKATFKQTVSGGVGGMSLVLAGHPLDTLKCAAFPPVVAVALWSASWAASVLFVRPGDMVTRSALMRECSQSAPSDHANRAGPASAVQGHAGLRAQGCRSRCCRRAAAADWPPPPQTVRKEGPLALYKGMMGPLVGVTPMYAVCFFGYGVGQQIFTTKDTFKNLNASNTALIGLAGAVSGVFTTPLMTPLERVKVARGALLLAVPR